MEMGNTNIVALVGRGNCMHNAIRRLIKTEKYCWLTLTEEMHVKPIQINLTQLSLLILNEVGNGKNTQ